MEVININIVLIFLFIRISNTFVLFPENGEYEYRIESQVTLVPDLNSTQNPQWSFIGKLIVHQINEQKLLLQIQIDGEPDFTYDIEKLYKPFLIKLQNDRIIHFYLSHDDDIWSANIKRGIAALFQVEGNSTGAFVDSEVGLFGSCKIEYFIVEKENGLQIAKTYDMDSCTSKGGIYKTKSNVPTNLCIEDIAQDQIINSRIGNYNLLRVHNSSYLLKSIDALMRTNVQTSLSYYPQFLYSSVHIELIQQNKKCTNDIDESKELLLSTLTFEVPKEATGGRNPKNSSKLVEKTSKMLIKLAENLNLERLPNFLNPLDESVSELMRLLGTMDWSALKDLYTEIDIGTSYKQETARNLLIEMIPRCGTYNTVLLTRDLIVNKSIKSTTAVQLLIALPFNLAEPSYKLVKECEIFLNLGPDRPDVKHAAVLSYATLIYKTFVAEQMTDDQFENYVKKYFNLFLNSVNYDEQMIYLQALSNLQIGKVAEYLESIIRASGFDQTTDIRFLSMWATFGTAHLRPDKVFNIYWPIFHSKAEPLELRIGAFVMLLVSNPTSGRLLALYQVVVNEKNPHMLNFYRTTILSLTDSTYSCYQGLKRFLSYMQRSLPEKPLNRYWTTGNYVFDYSDRKFKIGAILQAMLIGNQNTDLPMMGYFKFDTEALSKFTGQFAFYIKARGLSDAIVKRLTKINDDYLQIEDLKSLLLSMKMPVIADTPLHLEIILQVQGKSILAYYLNQDTFQNLTDGDLIERIQALVDSDTHVNMQNVVRPFMIQYLFSTIFGTSADILLENSIINTLRGNTTKNNSKLIRNTQIEFQHISYAVAKIRSYNPINDCEFATIREQGMLIFAPMINELKLDLTNNLIRFAFYRPKNLTTGLALMNRVRNTPLTSYLVPDMTQKDKIKSYNFWLNDIGWNISLNIQQDYAQANIKFMMESDIRQNIKILEKSTTIPFYRIMDIFSLLQLNSIQIGQDKYLTVLLCNPETNYLEGLIGYGFLDYSKDTNQEEEKQTLIFASLSHKTDYEDPVPLHYWNLSATFSTFKQNNIQRQTLELFRKDRNGQKWKINIKNNITPFVFLQSPLIVTTDIVIRNCIAANQCLAESKINIHLTMGVLSDIVAKYKKLKNNDVDCPKDVVKFPIYFGKCSVDVYKNYTDFGELNLIVNFEEIPFWLNKIVKRLDHLLSAILPKEIDNLNMTDNIHFSIRKNEDSGVPNITLNGIVFDSPMDISFKWKYFYLEEFFISYGIQSVCSIVSGKLNSFYNKELQVNEHNANSLTIDKFVLILADCSELPKFAILASFQNDTVQTFKVVKLYVGGHEILIQPNSVDVNLFVVKINGEPINLPKGSYFQYPKMEQYYDYRFYINSENVFVLENKLLNSILKLNMRNILTVKIPVIHRRKICGLCSLR